MIELPDRLTPIQEMLEAGEIPTNEHLNRVGMLQALDMVKMQQEAVRQSQVMEERGNELLQEMLGHDFKRP